MAIFYTDCLLKPRAGMILFYVRTCQITKSLFSLEFYGAFYKGLTTNIITCPAILTMNGSIMLIYLFIYVYTLESPKINTITNQQYEGSLKGWPVVYYLEQIKYI